MAILVSDTSVIIDLERGALLEPLFQLPYQFAVPDYLFETELAGDGLGAVLLELGLRVEELDPAELTRATEVVRERPDLSAQDGFAFSLAEQRDWPLLAGDGGLRKLAAQCGVEVHGVLWVCDRFEEHQVIGLALLHQGLSAIGNHHRCRLPASEIQTRLTRYAEG